MKKVPSADVKKRSRELTVLFESFDPYRKLEGTVQRVWITEIAADKTSLVRLSVIKNFPLYQELTKNT